MLINWVNKIEAAKNLHNFRVEETESYVQLRFYFSLQSKQSILDIIETKSVDFIDKVTIRHDEASEDLGSLTLEETGLSEGDECSLLILKSNKVPPFFITQAGFEKSLHRITQQRVIFINDDVGFSSLSCRFIPISQFELHSHDLVALYDCEDSFATFIGGRVEFLAEISIPFFALKDTTTSTSPYFTIWKNESCKLLCFLNGNKLELTDGAQKNLISKSDKKLTFHLDSTIDINSFHLLQELVKWIISPRRDAKVRHQIYIGCLTREGDSNTDFWKFFNESAKSALEAAQLNYDSLLDKEARESLKVMIDIRKAIFDTAAQISKDAQEISSRAAADIAAAIGLLIARAALIAKSSIDAWAAQIILVAAIFYIFYRIYSVLYISNEFFKSTDIARKAWNTRVYCNLNAKDREELSEKPIERSKKILLRSIFIARSAYVIIILILAFLLFCQST